MSRPRGGEGMVREGRRQADPADSLLSELSNLFVIITLKEFLPGNVKTRM